jgi:hypothetical protein
VAANDDERHRASRGGQLRAWVVGALVAVVGGALYGAALAYAPNVYVAVLLPGIYGASVARVASAIGRRFAMRGRRLGTFALTLTMAGYMLSWIPWEWLTFRRLGHPIEPLAAMHPRSFFALLGLLYDSGAWTLGSASAHDAVSGWRLGVCWALEALLVLGAAVISAYRASRA